MQVYDEEFFRKLKEGARASARVVVPMLMRWLRPRSVIDLGCGVGTWLSIFRENGVEDVLGADGDYVNRAMLDIPADRFIPADLALPFTLDRRFHLACSLEVAEHLPTDKSEQFVQSLTRLAPAVLFSAAIPHQGGAEHVNEQWQDYWARLFEKQGYYTIDCLRRRIWSHPQVEYWYAQNLLLYVNKPTLDANEALQREYEAAGTGQLAIVHPKRYLEWVEWGFEQCGRAQAAEGRK